MTEGPTAGADAGPRSADAGPEGPGRLEVRLLGPPSLGPVEAPRPFPTGRPGRLLARLLLARGRAVDGDLLVADVWPDEPPGDARSALHTTVARVRRALGPHATLLRRLGPGYRIDAGAVELDLDDFLALAVAPPHEPAAASLARCDRALALWRGSALPGWEDLAEGEVRRLAEAHALVREDRAAALVAAGDAALAAGELRVLVGDHPLRERGVALLMTALHRCGDVDAALAAYEEHRRLLADQLGLDPSPALGALHAEVLRRESGDASLGVPDAVSPESGIRAPVAPHLYGREPHLAGLRRMLERHRLVTVVGPGGVGKTSLAASAAAGEVHWWADLASLTDPGLVPRALAEALGVAEFPGGTLEEALRRWLHTAAGVLVVDNCEHLLAAAAAAVEEVCTHGPGVRVLATSRERLGLSVEQVLPLPPLELPGAADEPGHARSIEESPAVELFWERARSVAPDLGHTPQTDALVADLVRRLDGLPLAIELAAGRVGTLTLTDLLARLETQPSLLRTRSSRQGERQRTLAATVTWSYELLEPEEQRAFRWLSFFVGVFDLDMAEALLGPDAVDLVSTLAERHLLVPPEATGPGRYRMLETLRSCAAVLCDAEERRSARRAHARCVATAAGRAAAAFEGPDEREAGHALDRLARDASSALAWAVEDADAPLATGLVASLRQWAYLGLRNEVLVLAFEVLALGPSAATASVHAAASAWFWRAGWTEEAREHAEAALAHAEPGSHEELVARDALADVAMALGNHDEAAALLRPAFDAAVADGRWRDASFAAMGVALATTYAGRPADEAVRQSREAAERSGNPSALAFSWFAEGEALAERDPEAALRALRRATTIATDLDNRIVVGISLTVATAVRARTGPLDGETVGRCMAAVEHWLASGNENLFLTCLRNLTPLLDRFGASRALVELVAATGAEDASGPDAARLGESLARARAELGEEAWAAALAAGRSRSTDEAGAVLVSELRELA